MVKPKFRTKEGSDVTYSINPTQYSPEQHRLFRHTLPYGIQKESTLHLALSCGVAMQCMRSFYYFVYTNSHCII